MTGVYTTRRYATTIQNKYIYFKFNVVYLCAYCKGDI